MVATAETYFSGSQSTPRTHARDATATEGRRQAVDMLRRLYGNAEEDVDARPWHSSGRGRRASGDVVLVRAIPFMTCEHHLLRCEGTAHVAYLSGWATVSASQLARTVGAVARQVRTPQHMAEQLADVLALHLSADAVAVVVETSHFCIEWSGVVAADARGSVLRGRFEAEPELGAEVVALLTAETEIRVGPEPLLGASCTEPPHQHA